jgi:hypothetical protein
MNTLKNVVVDIRLKNKMSIQFRGGELQQKGKGIGGFFRGLVNFFKPMMKSVGNSVVKVATSDTAKSIAKTLGEQALDSTMNMTKDVLHGNDLQDSFHREIDNFKRTGVDIVDNLQSKRVRAGMKNQNSPKRKVTLKTMKRYESRSRPY